MQKIRLKAKKKKRNFYLIIIITCLVIITINGIVFFDYLSNINDSIVKQGQVYLPKSTLEKPVALDGYWGFYWNEFFYSFDVDNTDRNYFFIPESWTRYHQNGKQLAETGYATYRVNVITDMPEGSIMALKFNTMFSAYDVYINNHLASSNGRISKEAKQEINVCKPKVVFFKVPAESFDIFIHLSNYQFAKGGFRSSVFAGTPEGILNFENENNAREELIIGALMITALFNLTIFFIKKDQKYRLYFSLFCVFAMVLMDEVNHYTLINMIMDISASQIIFLGYSCLTWAVFFFILYTYEIFKTRVSLAITRISLVVSVCYQLLFIIVSPLTYSRYTNVNNAVEFFVAFLALVIIYHGIKNDYKDSELQFLGIVVLLGAYISGILFSNVFYSSFGTLCYLGVMLFLVIHSALQVRQAIAMENLKNAAELAFFRAQIKPHFFYNTINMIIAVSRKNVDLSRQLLGEFAEFLRFSFDFNNTYDEVPLDQEISLAKAYATLEITRFAGRLDIVFNTDVEENSLVPALVLQPLIENSINHGIWPKKGKGRIIVSIWYEAKNIYFKVEDDGVGIDEKMLDHLNTESKKCGVGLGNVDTRLKMLYKEGLTIRSKLDVGTEISWKVPVRKKT